MAIEKIFIARHGFRLNWVSTNWKSETGLPRDPPLAAFGVSQAEELAAYFLSLPIDERPTAIFSSPYYRCLQTSQPVAKALDLPIYVEHGLAEWYSPVADACLHPRPGTSESLKAYFPEISPNAWDSIYYPTRKGENVEQVHDRARAFLGTFGPEVQRRFPEKDHKRVLLVSHAATVITLARELAGDRNLPVRVGCCSLTEATKSNGKWLIDKLATGEHLTGGSSREWGFEDIEISDGQVVADPGVPGTEGEQDAPVGLQVSRNSNL